MSEQNCAARKALEEIAALRLNPYCRIVPSGAVAVELERASTAALINTIVGRGLAAPCEHAAEAERLRKRADTLEWAVGVKDKRINELAEEGAKRWLIICGLEAELDTLRTERQEIARVLESFANWFRVMNVILQRDEKNGITRQGGWEDSDPVVGALGQIVTRGYFRLAAELHARLTQEKPEEQR